MEPQESTPVFRVSAALSDRPNLDAVQATVVKSGRFRYLRDVLGDEKLAKFSGSLLKKAVDGVYYLTQREADEFKELAQLLASTPHIHLSQLGRSSTLAQLVRDTRARDD